MTVNYNCKYYDFLKSMVDPRVAVHADHMATTLKRSEINIPLKEKIQHIGAFFNLVGDELVKSHPSSLKQICNKLLKQSKEDKELQKLIRGIFDLSIKITESKIHSTLLYCVAEAPKNFTEFLCNLSLVLKNHPRYQFGNDLEVYE